MPEQPLRVWFFDNYEWLLLLSCLALFATKNGATYALTVMSVLGLYRLANNFSELLAQPAIKYLLLCFLCLWLPLLIALSDAANPGRSAQTVFSYLRYLFAGIFIVQVVSNESTYRKILLGSVTIVTFWTLDAMVQYFFGQDLFGYPHDSLQLAGMFYPKLRLGLLIAVMLPVLFEGLRRYAEHSRWWLLIALPALAVILLSANRNAWMMATVALLCFAVYLYRTGFRPPIRVMLAIGLTTCVFLGGVTAVSDKPLLQRFENTTQIFSSDFDTVDRATSYRLSLWKTAVNTFEQHWFNGVGPRGFRYVYQDLAAEDDFWMTRFGRGQTHPHQFVLEVAAETGTVGLAALLLFWWVVFRAARKGRSSISSIPWLIAVIVAAFPLNAHLAFYSSYWSTVLWWVLPIFLGLALAPTHSGTTTEPRAHDGAHSP